MSESEVPTGNESNAQRQPSTPNGGGKQGLRFDVLLVGLMLIGLGALLLVGTLNPEIDFRDLIVTWWPLLLIAAGVIKIVQATFGISGGGSGFGFLLAVVIALIVIAGVPWQWIDVDGFFFFGPVTVYSDNVDIQPGDELELLLEHADARLYGHSGDDVRMRVRTFVSGWSSKESRLLAEKFKVDVRRAGNVVTLVAEPDKLSDGRRRVRAELEIGLPREQLARIQARRSDVDIDRLDSEITVDSEYGDVDVVRSSGRITVDIENGDVDVYDFPGDLTVTGNRVDVDLTGVYGIISIDIVRGSIELDNLRAIEGDMEIRTQRGGIEVEFDEDSDFELEADSTRGRIYCDFAGFERDGVKTLRHTFNAGTYKVVLTSGSGNIEIDSD